MSENIKNWRPDNWSNPCWKRTKPISKPELIIGQRANAFEAGADAMLKAVYETITNPHKWIEFWRMLDDYHKANPDKEVKDGENNRNIPK